MSARLPVPDLVIGGAPRSGTTFLAEILDKHPQIFVARPIAPEPKVCLRDHPEGMAGYLAEYARYFTGAPANALRVEKTTNYFENEAAVGRLAAVLPQARFLFILREPVARAYSNWRWSTMNKLETLSFAEAVELEGQRPNPFGKEREAARPFDYMSRSRYGTLAARWYALFDHKRIRFVVFEDLIQDPEYVLSDLQAWLGVEPLSWAALRMGRVNPAPEDASGLDPALRQRLRTEIQAEVAEFGRISGLNVTAWGYP